MLDASTVDPILAQHFASLAELGARRTASSITTRIQASRAAKDHEQTVVDLQEIIQELLQERGELLLIATAMKDRLVAQSIDGADIKYMADSLIPALEDLTARFSPDGGEGAEQALEVLKRLLSPEILTILQVLGFNYKQGIGTPLTALTEAHLRRLMPRQDDDTVALKQLDLQVAAAQLALDPEAYDRFRQLTEGSSDAAR